MHIWAYLTIIREIIIYKIIGKNNLVNIRKRIFSTIKILVLSCQNHVYNTFDIKQILDHDMFWLADLIGKYTEKLNKDPDYNKKLDTDKILAKTSNIFVKVILNIWNSNIAELPNIIKQKEQKLKL